MVVSLQYFIGWREIWSKQEKKHKEDPLFERIILEIRNIGTPKITYNFIKHVNVLQTKS